MPDAFFASNKNRKRKRNVSSDQGPSTSKKPSRAPPNKRPGLTQSKRKPRDEELSDKTSDDEDGDIDGMDLRAPDADAYESAEEDEDETPAEKRLRLARLYLEGVKQDLTLADGEFDAAEIDKELISARLKQDVMEHSGKVHLFVADNYDFSNTPTLKTRGHSFSVTAAVASEDARFLYTSSKDGSIFKWDLHTGRKLHVFRKVRPPPKSKTKDNGKGKGKAKADPHALNIQGHSDEIWALALSPDGKLLASAGKDRRIGVWDVEKDEWIKGFTGHRDSISALAFRKTSKTSASTPPRHLYSGSFDRTLKLFDLSPQTMGYVETLFGHQAPVLSIDSLMRETAVSVGGRDKSVRYWKIPEETQLVLRGGGKSGWEDVLAGEDGMDVDGQGGSRTRRGKGRGKQEETFMEGSIECVAMIDEETFLSGGDSGSICLWTTQKKKPVFTQALAHGFDESQTTTDDPEIPIVRKPRYITALASPQHLLKQEARPPNLHPTNALAGPSTIPQYPTLFLPDPVPERRKPKFTSTDDLISRFQLLPTYDRYVRPYVTPTMGGGAQAAIDKGKGKERERDPSTPAGQTPGAGNEAEDEESQTKGEKKWRNNYKHLIKDIPGKHSMKKEDYLVPMMQVPPKQRNDIKPFDLRTQREAFSVSLEGLKGWNINVLVAESPQAREDRKRRKELKRIAKAQAQAQAQGTPAAGTPAGHPATPGAPSVGTPGHPPVRTGTPKPNLANNRPSVPQPQARGRTPVGVGTPRSVSTPGGPQSHVSIPTSHSAPQVSTPAPTPNAGPTTMDVRRGVKRERDDSVTPMNGNGNANAPMVANHTKPSAVVNAKAGVNGVRPRKRQRVQEPQGHAMAVQQPTPRA